MQRKPNCNICQLDDIGHVQYWTFKNLPAPDFCIFKMRDLEGWLYSFLKWRIYSLVENLFLRKTRILSFFLSSVNNTSLLSCSFVRIKAFCPKYDRLWLLRKYRQEESIMGLSFDNNSKFLQTTGWFFSFSTPLALFGCSLQEKIYFSASCTYKKSLGKIPHVPSPLQGSVSCSLTTAAWECSSVPTTLTSGEHRTVGRLWK